MQALSFQVIHVDVAEIFGMCPRNKTWIVGSLAKPPSCIQEDKKVLLTMLLVFMNVLISRLQAFIDFKRMFRRALYCEKHNKDIK